MGGTVFAQGLVVLSSPILTRMYTPENFGILGIFISLISILSSVVSMKYELALPLTRNLKETINLFILNILLISILSFLFLLIFLLFGDYIFSLLGVYGYVDLLRWLIPLTLFFMGITINITYLFVKLNKFKNIASIKVNSTMVKVVSQLLLGTMPSSNFGLIAGDIFGRFLGAILSLYLVFNKSLNQIYIYILRNMCLLII